MDTPLITLDLLPGLPVWVDDRSAEIGGSFYYEPLRVYDPAPLQWAWEHIQNQHPCMLLDIGASAGCYSLLAAHKEDMMVHAFDIVPKTLDVLRANVAINGLQQRVGVWNVGVSDYHGDGVAHCVYPEGGSGVSMLNGTPRPTKAHNDVPVRVTTVDTFCNDLAVVPTLIKIDTEGGEMNVLQGAIQTLKAHHPLIICEYIQENADQYGYQSEELIAFLESYGYQVEKGGSDIYGY